LPFETANRSEPQPHLEGRGAAPPLLVTRCSADLRYVFANRAYAELLGKSPEELAGRPIAEIIGPEALAVIMPHVERVLRGEEVEYEIEIPFARTGRRTVHALYTPDRDQHGNVLGWVATMYDTTLQRRAEAAHRESEARFQDLADAAPVMIWISASDKLCTWFNKTWLEFGGRPPERELGSGWVDRVHPDDVDACLDIYTSAFDARRTFTREYRLLRHDGVYRWILDRGIPRHRAEKEFAGYIGSCFDITERKEHQTRLTAETHALARLNDLSARLWRMRSLREGLDEMLAAAIELLGADMGNVQLFDADHGVLRIAAQRGLGPEFLAAFREVSAEHGAACGRALRARVRIVIEDVEADPQFAPLRDVVRRAGFRAVQSTPLIGRDGSPLGMLSTHFRSVHRPEEQDLRRLDLYLRQATDFIERCRTEEAMRDVDQRKNEFLATLAHELRNPLAPIRNAVQVLRFKGTPAPEVLWARDVIERQMQQMTRLIDDLMDISRITRDRLELRLERVELARVVQGAIEMCRPLLDGSLHQLVVDLPPEKLCLDADFTRLAQVFSNLLNNAVKYSDPGTRIVLTAKRQGGEAVVAVRDTGIGIPKEMLSRIFELFTQVDRSLEGSRGGLGIGLSLVKRLVEMHRGSVTAHSDGPGTGSEFTVRLPLAVRPAQEPAPPAVAPPAVTPPPAASARHRILIVDDNQDAALTTSTMLDMLGYETRTAPDGLAGLDLIDGFRPDVALLDIGMPKLNGHDLARRIRAHPQGKHVVLIAVTGWGQAEDRQRTADAGFDHHLVKPVDPAVLAALLARVSAREGVL
jgi:PAS domain S-box-containing protein